jgi:hypothetical protein
MLLSPKVYLLNENTPLQIGESTHNVDKISEDLIKLIKKELSIKIKTATNSSIFFPIKYLLSKKFPKEYNYISYMDKDAELASKIASKLQNKISLSIMLLNKNNIPDIEEVTLENDKEFISKHFPDLIPYPYGAYPDRFIKEFLSIEDNQYWLDEEIPIVIRANFLSTVKDNIEKVFPFYYVNVDYQLNYKEHPYITVRIDIPYFYYLDKEFQTKVLEQFEIENENYGIGYIQDEDLAL